MLSIKHETRNGPTTYLYDTISGKSISTYMSEWQKVQRRKKRTSEGLPEFIHADEVPHDTAKIIVEMRDRGKSWSQISRKFNFTDYISKKVYNLHKNKNNF